MSEKAIILFAHGARADAWASPFRRLQALLQQRESTLRVELAFLEFMSPSLPDLVDDLVSAGIKDLRLVPVFFGQGGHVMRDLPLMIEAICAKYPELIFKQSEAVGESEMVLQAICDYCLQTVSEA